MWFTAITPNVSRATVYRNLSVLSERGEVLRIPVPNAADRYDFRCDNHFHAKCSRCGGVFDIETEGVDPFARIVNDYGFEVTGFDLRFWPCALIVAAIAGNSAECVDSRPPIWVFRGVSSKRLVVAQRAVGSQGGGARARNERLAIPRRNRAGRNAVGK